MEVDVYYKFNLGSEDFTDVSNVSIHGNTLIITWSPGNSYGIDLLNVEALNVKEDD